MVKASPFIHQAWPSGAKGKWRISSWLAISNTREKKNTRYIFTSVVATFLRAFRISHSLYEKSHLSRGKIELKNGIACPLGAAVYLRYFKSFKLIYEDLSVRVFVAWFGVGIARSAKIYHHNETCAPHRRNSKIICKITKENTLASLL